MTPRTEAQAKLQLRRIEQLNASNALNDFKYAPVVRQVADGFDEIRDRLKADFEKVFGGDQT